MQNFKHYNRNVKLVDKKFLDITFVGDVLFNTNLGMKFTLKNVKFFLYLKRILILVRQLDNENHHVTFGHQQWKVNKGTLILAKGKKHGIIYMAEVSKDETPSVEEVCNDPSPV